MIANDHMADMPTAEFRVRGILHVDNPAGDEDTQPCQEKVLHLDGWETTLQTFGQRAEEHQMDQSPQNPGHHERLLGDSGARNQGLLSDHILTANLHHASQITKTHVQ